MASMSSSSVAPLSLAYCRVEGELPGVAAGGQRRDRDKAAVTGRQLRVLPRVTEQHVVSEVHEPGREAAEHLLRARRLLVVGGGGHWCPSVVGGVVVQAALRRRVVARAPGASIGSTWLRPERPYLVR